MNPNVDFYFHKAGKWQPELRALRHLVLACGLMEELKWGVPGYTFQRSNVVLLHAFNDYCAVLFVKGALLHDASGLLVQQTPNTQAARQLRFGSLEQITSLAPTITAYVYEAIEVERAGLKVDFKPPAALPVPEEFAQALAKNIALQTAFEALTAGRQRGYLLHFASPKLAGTRAARVEKCTHKILEGKGLND